MTFYPSCQQQQQQQKTKQKKNNNNNIFSGNPNIIRALFGS
jgi:hypothetical protein